MRKARGRSRAIEWAEPYFRECRKARPSRPARPSTTWAAV